MKFDDAARLIDPQIIYQSPLPEPGQKKGKRIKHPKVELPETVPELKKELRRMQKVKAMDKEVNKRLTSQVEHWDEFFGHEYSTFNDKLDTLDKRLANLIPDSEYEALLEFCDPSNFGEQKDAAIIAYNIVKTLRDSTERKRVLESPSIDLDSVPDTDDTEDN